jgi:hypothetical protein
MLQANVIELGECEADVTGEQMDLVGLGRLDDRSPEFGAAYARAALNT